MDYKDTLLLPKTSFPMRGNLPQAEPKRYQKWSKNRVYEKMKKNRKDRDLFTLHDGPPYANGHLHIGHALNKILKDMIVKYHYFQGKAVRYTPGWDCHGLPIEQKVEEKLGRSKKEAMSVADFRKECRKHATKFVEIQKEEFKSFGVVADWENPYLTMDFKFQANIYRALCKVAKRGLIVERSKPIHWSWAARTALAEAEIEYEDKEDYSIYVAFELNSEAKSKLDIENGALVIWTTTPWTLPANVGIALNPDAIYVLTKDGYIVAKERVESLVQEGVLSSNETLKEFKSSELEHLKAINPLNGRDSYVILGDFVELDGGTGCVHSAPGHGEVDYFASLKYNLDVIMPVDDRGCYDESVVALNLLPEPESFVGEHIFKANDRILELLGNSLLKVSKFTHSYPHCWRTKKPVIYRATKQIFIAVDKLIEDEDKTLRELALNALKGVKFYPEHSSNRISSMIEGRPDWCISRQRSWGVPIAFFRKKDTKELILDEKVLNFVAMIFDIQGADAWYELPIEQLLYPGSGYKPEELEKVTDILDVWFDSGSSWNATLASGNYDAGSYPANMYLEGTDQHRGWFQSSLLVSCGANSIAPYKSLLTHGFTVDEKGEKMSKSKGNVVAPDKVIKQFGSEILRLWVALSDYTTDLKISDNILKQTAEQYRKIRNSFRFLLANLDGLESIDFNEFGELDKWILNKASTVFKEVNKEFSNYEFARAFSLLNNFLTNELSGIYMDLCKDRLYCDAKDSNTRVGAQVAMYLIAKSMLALIAPVLTYTADEILEHAPTIFKDNLEDIFDLEYQKLPEFDSTINDELLIKARESFNEAVDKLRKEKIVKSTLELVIVGDSSIFNISNKKDLEDWFGVSGFESSVEKEELTRFSVNDKEYIVIKSPLHKCPRCWRYTAKAEDELCDRCAEVVK